MQNDLENFFHRAEDHYLQEPEMIVFRHEVTVMQQRLATYECLRDNELLIFQTIADALESAFADENPQRLERAIKHWVAVMRYCAMAMLLNNSTFLQHRLLEWLTDIVKAYEMQVIERHLAELLLQQLVEILTSEQMELLQPFLVQASTTLLDEAKVKTAA